MEKELSELADQELLEKKRTIEARNISNAVILGVLVGIAIYSMITKGISLMTFIPVLFAFFVANSWNKDKKALKKELSIKFKKSKINNHLKIKNLQGKSEGFFIGNLLNENLLIA